MYWVSSARFGSRKARGSWVSRASLAYSLAFSLAGTARQPCRLCQLCPCIPRVRLTRQGLFMKREKSLLRTDRTPVFILPFRNSRSLVPLTGLALRRRLRYSLFTKHHHHHQYYYYLLLLSQPHRLLAGLSWLTVLLSKFPNERSSAVWRTPAGISVRK